MNITRVMASLILAANLLSTSSALADFTGSFSGIYAPANWTIAVSGNPTYQNSAQVDTSGAPDIVTIYGALGVGTVPSAPSIIDYSILLPGGSPNAQSISFGYTFFNPLGSPAAAQVLDNGVVVGSLQNGTSLFQLDGDFQGGGVLTFRVVSGNVNQADFLQITPVPEPSTLALASLGGAALLLQFRRQPVKR
ncbi:MAG: hypothetical protein JWQ04_1237 [Pedosphaera sp.]|nr:hypothetical protein [Pedosphaera sp.]